MQEYKDFTSSWLQNLLPILEGPAKAQVDNDWRQCDDGWIIFRCMTIYNDNKKPNNVTNLPKVGSINCQKRN